MQRNRKIVIVGPAYPLRGGLASYNERLARAYQQQGDEVVIFTFKLQYPGFLFPGKTQYSTDKAPNDLNIRVKVNSINPFNWWSIGKEIKKLKADLLIIKFWIPFMAPCLGTIARIVRKNKTTKVISIIDNIIPHEKRTGDYALANYWVKSVDGFIAMSKSVLTDLETFDKKRPKLFCPHPLYDNFGIPITKSEAQKLLGINSGDKYILFFGFIRDYKGLDILLRAMADSRIRAKGIRLIVAGEFYTDSKKYLAIIEEENLGDQVILATDFIPDNEVSRYFSAADLVVQPYKNATQSGVTQIAYHFNKPMITTNVGGLAEIVPDGKVGYVVKPDIGAISDAILRFYDSNKETEFIEGVKEEKVKYTWENMLKTIDKLTES
jgi:glycosyltransferase involved in cell wall biosynthesis